MSDDNFKAWVVWSNTDLCKGRGRDYPKHICLEKATALRLAKGNYVQGTDAIITEVDAFNINGVLYGPIDLIRPTSEDLREQNKIDKQERLAKKRKNCWRRPES